MSTMRAIDDREELAKWFMSLASVIEHSDHIEFNRNDMAISRDMSMLAGHEYDSRKICLDLDVDVFPKRPPYAESEIRCIGGTVIKSNNGGVKPAVYMGG